MTNSLACTDSLPEIQAVEVVTNNLTNQEHSENLPGYSLEAPFMPMAPTQNDRYSRIALVSPEYIKIPRGLHATLLLPEPPYLGEGWMSYLNPEGSPFYVHHAKRIVTDDPIHRSDAYNKIVIWEERLDHLILTDGSKLPDEYELYITACSDTDVCKYYFVDHTTQTIFWLEEIDPEHHDLGLPPVCSIAHLRYKLQEQYWTHNEYFPYRPVSTALKKELIDTFRHARADQMTSEMSTFPYNAQQCKRYLEIIDVDTDCNEYMTWILARLWATVARHRFDSFYGEDYAKTSRDQRRYDKPSPKKPLGLTLCSALLFGLPKSRAEALDMLSVDSLVYDIHWREFATDLRQEWRESSNLAVGLLVISTVSMLRPANPVSACLGSISIILSLSGVTASAILLQWYSGAEKLGVGVIANHLSKIEHPTCGYEPIAQAYSLPRALAFWSIVFLAAHLLSAVVDTFGLVIQVPAIFLASIFLVGFCHINKTLHNAFDTTTCPVYQPSESGSTFFGKVLSLLQRVGNQLHSLPHSS